MMDDVYHPVNQANEIFSSKLKKYVQLKSTSFVAVRPYIWLQHVPKERSFPVARNFSDILEMPTSIPANAPAHYACANAYFKGDLKGVSCNILHNMYSDYKQMV